MWFIKAYIRKFVKIRSGWAVHLFVNFVNSLDWNDGLTSSLVQFWGFDSVIVDEILGFYCLNVEGKNDWALLSGVYFLIFCFWLLLLVGFVFGVFLFSPGKSAILIAFLGDEKNK